MKPTVTDWAWAQRAKDGEPLAANLRLALLALARAADAKGCFTLRRKEIAELLQCSLDTVDRRIKKLEGEGLLTVERVPRKNGYGPSKYTLAMAAAGRNTAATCENGPSRIGAASGQRNPAARGNAELRLGESAKVAATGAASIRKPSNTVEEETQFYPETPELVFESEGAHAPALIMSGGGPFRDEWVLGDPERKFANDQGLRNGSVDVAFAMFGAHHASKGTVTVNWKAEWKKWVLRQAHDPRFKSNHEGAHAHDQQRTGAADASVYGRGKRNRHSDFLKRQLQPDGDALDLGRLDSSPVS